MYVNQCFVQVIDITYDPVTGSKQYPKSVLQYLGYKEFVKQLAPYTEPQFLSPLGYHTKALCLVTRWFNNCDS